MYSFGWNEWFFYVHVSLMITMPFVLNTNCTACAKFLCQPCGWLSVLSVYLYTNQHSYTITWATFSMYTN